GGEPLKRASKLAGVRRDQSGTPAFRPSMRRRGYKIPTLACQLRQQTTPVATVGSISLFLMPPYPLSSCIGGDPHESTSFHSRLSNYCSLQRRSLCPCFEDTSRLRKGKNAVGRDHQEVLLTNV